jgi:hypothetical protein
MAMMQKEVILTYLYGVPALIGSIFLLNISCDEPTRCFMLGTTWRQGDHGSLLYSTVVGASNRKK